MAAGTGIYVPVEQLGDNTPSTETFLRGDSKWVAPTLGLSPEELFNLLAYAFQRIQFLEVALGVNYATNDINVPDEFALIQDRIQWM